MCIVSVLVSLENGALAVSLLCFVSPLCAFACAFLRQYSLIGRLRRCVGFHDDMPDLADRYALLDVIMRTLDAALAAPENAAFFKQQIGMLCGTDFVYCAVVLIVSP